MNSPEQGQEKALTEALDKMPELSRVQFRPTAFQLERKDAYGDRYDVTVPTVLSDRLSVFTVPVTNYRQNCRIVRCEQTGETTVIDPGGASKTILSLIKENNMDVKQIWLTHAHPDHCGACKELQRETGAQISGSNHWMERAMRFASPAISVVYNIKDTGLASCPAPDVAIKKGDVLSLGTLDFSVYSTPGHAPGHLSFHNTECGILFAGDLFFGRYDHERRDHDFSLAPTSYPGGNAVILTDTVGDLLELPAETLVFGGHRDDFMIKTARDHAHELFPHG